MSRPWWTNDSASAPRGTALAVGLLTVLLVFGSGEYLTGMFSASAQVLPPVLTKSFTDDLLLPGDTVVLEFTIDNVSPQDATDIAFTDNLDIALSGLMVAPGQLPESPCGEGSALSGSAFLDFSGGSLLPNDSCTFSVPLEVPGTAIPGVYTNTTSPLTSSLGVGSPATVTVLVSPVNFYPLAHRGGDFYSAETSGSRCVQPRRYWRRDDRH